MDIPNKWVRLASKTLSKSFAFIYNKLISTGIVPNVFKVSKLTPVFKVELYLILIITGQ